MVVLLAMPVWSQIVLPDFYEDDDPFADETHVPDPERAGGMHARPDREEADDEKEEAVDLLNDPATRRMIQQMNMASAPRGGRIIRQPNNAAEVAEQEWLEHLLAGPEWVEADSLLEDGTTRQYELPNQTLLLDTPAGSIPLRLHELASMKSVRESEGIFRLELRDGDLISGKLVQLPVVKIDDSLRRLEAGEIREIILSSE